MGIGNATGENRAIEAAKEAIQSPLLETSIRGAKGVLLNIAGGANLSLLEVNEASTLVTESCDPEANIIFGASIREDLGEEIRITVIATGFDEAKHMEPEVIEKVKTSPKPTLNTAPITTKPSEVEVKEEVAVTREEPRRSSILDDDMEIPTFLRRRR